MSYCTECGSKHDKDALFCDHCGNKLESSILLEKAIPETLIKSNKFNKYKGLRVLLVSLLISLVLSLGIVSFLLLNNSSLKLMYGAFRAIREPNPEFTLELSIQEATGKYDFLEALDLEISASMRERDLSGYAGISYGDKYLAELDLAYENGHLFFDLGTLYDPVLYLESGDKKECIEAFIAMNAYLQNIELKGVKWYKYVKIIEKEMNNSIEKDGKDILLTLNIKDLSKMFQGVLKEAALDKDLKEGLQTTFKKVLKDMINDDYKILNFEKNDFENLLKEVDENWDEVYEGMVGHGRRILEYNEDHDDGINISDLENGLLDGQIFRFSFDFYKIKDIEAIFDIKGMEVVANLSLKNRREAKAYSIATSDQLNDYDKKEIGYLILDVTENIINNVKNNKSLIEELEKSSVFKGLAKSLTFEDMEKLLKILKNESVRRLINRLIFN